MLLCVHTDHKEYEGQGSPGWPTRLSHGNEIWATGLMQHSHRPWCLQATHARWVTHAVTNEWKKGRMQRCNLMLHRFKGRWSTSLVYTARLGSTPIWLLGPSSSVDTPRRLSPCKIQLTELNTWPEGAASVNTIIADHRMHCCPPQVFEAWHQHRQRRGLHGLMLHHVNTNAPTRFHSNNRFPPHQPGAASHLCYSPDPPPCDQFLCLHTSTKKQLQWISFAELNLLAENSWGHWYHTTWNHGVCGSEQVVWTDGKMCGSSALIWKLAWPVGQLVFQTIWIAACTRLACVFLDHLYPKCSLHPICPTQWCVWMLISPLHLRSRSSWEQGTINHCTGYLSDVYAKPYINTVYSCVCACVCTCMPACACMFVTNGAL